MSRTTSILAFVLVACSSSKSPPVPAASLAAPAPAAAASLAASEPRPMRSLGGQLAFERNHRPTAGLTGEAVFTALGQAGLSLAPPKQYLGMTAGAAFCQGTRTPAGVALAVCEYPDAAAAERGKAHVETRYAAIAPQRTILVRGTTTLTVTAAAGALATDDGRKAAETFSRL